MKLEELVSKKSITDIDNFSASTRKIIEELAAKKDPNTAAALIRIILYTQSEGALLQSIKTISKRDKSTAMYIANGLYDIASNTKDGTAVEESAKTIRRYRKHQALEVADALAIVAENTGDKNKIIAADRIMSLDRILSKGLKYGFFELTKIAAYTEDETAVEESANTLMKYDPVITRSIAQSLDTIARNTGDKTAVEESAKTIRRYSKDNAENIAYNLGSIARNTKDGTVVEESAKTVRKYDKNRERDIVGALVIVAENTGDKNKIIAADRIMSLDRILSKGLKYGFFELTKIAAYTEDETAVEESARTIMKYDPVITRSIAQSLDTIARNTKDGTIVKESARTIRRYGKDTAKTIAYRLQNIATEGDITYGVYNIIVKGSGESVMAACGILNLIGTDALDLLENKNLTDIRKRKLDDLINNKERIVSKYLSERYGIAKKLNINQILMLLYTYKDKRKELADFINNSNEISLKTYSISTEETKRLEVDTKRLSYLSLIAVTGSRDKELDKEAYDTLSEIAGKKAVEKARTAFKSHYSSAIKGIAGYVKEGKVNEAIDYLKAVKNESIDDILGCANYRNSGFNRGKTVINAVESNNPLDYDNRVQIACVYLPQNYHNGIYNYCKDYYSEDKKKGFILVRYDIEEKVLGSAICYMENDKFLVDSVEGHRTFRKPQIFEAVYQDLVERAKEKGARTIIFSHNGINETPKDFIEFLRGLKLKKDSVKMELYTEGYLEAGKNGVTGYTVNLD
ncbi:MAG: hypothetical protein BJBARM4_0439 [Candidatus Parvarchaeum acidiphilum ARMAN-4]|uniref:Uncharacterized protein n=1 Tax=Candidatus Parvarchaeum acidiphilum ARMAN-4 TaxID=662760 RepID=D2EFC1_PARA4|nr:MAG: hypothetical protein BJBARM4_0439 [Candidatus Parvarchaeum acidiphilum ARMAN-4]